MEDIVSPLINNWINKVFKNGKSLSAGVTEGEVMVLLTSVIEGLACRGPPKNTSQTTSRIQTLSNITSLLEEFLTIWLTVRYGSNGPQDPEDGNDGNRSWPTGYLLVALLTRLVLRIWSLLVSLSSSSTLSPSHISDLQELLPRPVAIVTKLMMSPTRDWLFKGNDFLNIEFTMLYLECLYVSLSAIEVFSGNSLVPAHSFVSSLEVGVCDNTQQWLIYTCSKLQSLPRSNSIMDTVVCQTHQLLAQITRVFIAISDHIHACQKAAKLHLVMQESVRHSVSLDLSMKFNQLEQHLCKISQSLLNIFDTVPGIQLLSLQLLAQTGMDKVGIISDFLPRISHKSVWSMPEILDLHLELLEKAWFQLSSDYPGSPSFWSKLSHYGAPLMEGSPPIALQVTYHLSFLLSHQSFYLKSAITENVLLAYHKKMSKFFKEKVEMHEFIQRSPGGRRSKSVGKLKLEIEEESLIRQYLKLLQKMATHPSSLIPFIEDNKNLYSLFLYLSVTQFRAEVLKIFGSTLKTVSTPWEASIPQVSKLSGTKMHQHLINSLLRVAFEFHHGKTLSLCEQLITSGATMGGIGFQKVDEVHIAAQELLEVTDIWKLLEGPVMDHMLLVRDVWGLLATVVSSCDSLIPIFHANYLWDVLQVLSLSLASLLCRVQEQQGVALPAGYVRLQELCVTLLCHLLTIATVICRNREDPLKVRV